MRSSGAFVLALLGVGGLACAQGSAAQPDDEPAASLEPAHPIETDAALAGKPPAWGDASVEPTDAADGAVLPAPDAAAATTFVSGSVAGVSISPASAGAVVVAAGGAVDRVVIAITTRAGFCADYANGIDHAGERTLVLVVIAKGATSSVAAATYAIGSSKPSSAGGSFDTSARVLAYDAQCQTTVAAANENATAGSITLTQVAGGALRGMFSLSFPGGGVFSGSLDAAVCTAPGADSFTCVP